MIMTSVYMFINKLFVLSLEVQAGRCVGVGVGVLPYICYMGMCHCEGMVFKQFSLG